jgi:hypothetical protein
MRRYVVIRLDRTKREFLGSELLEGRLRQGWGWKAEHDLRLLAARLATGAKPTDEEASVWRNRRLLDTQRDGLKPGDIVIVPNHPKQGRWRLAEVIGPYRFELASTGPAAADYGHIVPVAVLLNAKGEAAEVEADNMHVHARLRATMRNLSRMWSVDALARPIENLIAAIKLGKDTTTTQSEAEKFDSLLKATKQAVWESIRAQYRAAELEGLVHRLMSAVYADGRVEHWGGAGEKGADLIVYTSDALGLEYKVGIQVKMHEGTHDDAHALAQLRRARLEHRIDAGVVVTTAERVSDGFEAQRGLVEQELGIDIRVIAREELLVLVMRYLACEPSE